MTDASGKPPSAHRYRLRTFGTLALLTPEDEPVAGKQGQQRRRLALLAVLAAAGERGRSRDQLLLLFWPDVTQTRARHSLEQLLYEIRNSVSGAVFEGVNPMRLTPDVVASDVGAFNEALERGDLVAAVGAYRGPFLDGFYLSDAPEFEQWMEAERARLERGYVDALERLARGAEAADDHAAAGRWWRKLTDADPVSSKYASGLIRALMDTGDHAAALKYAERYKGVVAKELGTSVGPAVADLVAEARAQTKTPPVAAFKSPTLTSPPATYDASMPVSAGAWPVDPVQPSRSPRRRAAPYVLAALAMVAIVAAVTWRRASRRSDASPAGAAAPSIAVLPFENLTGDKHDAALVDGLSEELIAVLGRIRNLRVIARTSSFAFRNSDAGVRRIADTLGVSHLLEGGVQRIGPRVRVQVRLVDARDGSTRWSETYDRELGDIFLVQSDIASTVARELDLRLSESTLARIKRGSTSNIAAYELYLRGNDPALMRSDSAARRGLEYLRQAVALDTTFAAAYAGLSRMQLRVGSGDDTAMSRRARLALAEQAALKAIALDDSLGDAHAALSLVRQRTYDLPSAEAEMIKAVALSPTDARIREWRGQLYVWTERPAEALEAARRALELDPLSPTANAEVARALLANGRCDEALVRLKPLEALRPPLLRARSIAAQCHARKQMWPEAVAVMQSIAANGGPRAQAMLGYVLARGGRTNEARRILAPLLDRAQRTKEGALEVAMVYAGLGENDQAFIWLDRAVDDHTFVYEFVPTLEDGLKGDSRFDRFRGRIGLRKR